MSISSKNRTPDSRDARGARPQNTDIRFELEPSNLDLTDRQLTADLRRVARRLKTRAMTMRAYSRHGIVTALTISRRFGGWNTGLKKAGLKPVKRSRVTPKEILDDLKRVGRYLKVKTFTRDQYLIHGKFGHSVVVRSFETWNNALRAAGLECRRTSPITPMKDLFDNLEMLWRKLGRPPRGGEVCKPLSRFNLRSYTNRFGTIRDALEAFVRYKKTTGGATYKPLVIPTHKPPMVHKTPRTPGWRLRFKILSRDGFRCRACGRSPAFDPAIQLHVDHKTPWSRGGETVEKNLQTLCEACNGGKSDWKASRRRVAFTRV